MRNVPARLYFLRKHMNNVEIWQCPVCGAQLDISALGFYSQVSCPECSVSEYVHTVISGCRVEGILGIGGMSVVLRARDLVLNRSVAIKLLNDAYRDQPERIARFENESAMMAKVRHDNVVAVYSAGHARNQFYIAMELINGRDLETYVQESGPLSAAQAVDYTIQAVKGLQAAHQAGVLHRDMKPGNIIITDEGKAKVLDFGLALGKAEEDTEEIIWATPYYVPPETLERRDEDARTDMYALGMTLRYLLTGVGDFSEPITSTQQLLHYKLTLPKAEDVLPFGTNASLCDVIDHMTAYNPQDRPANYADLLAELNCVQTALKSEDEVSTPSGRRNLIFKALKYGSVTLGLGAAVAGLTAYLCVPEPQREYVSPREFSIPAPLQAAEQALAQGDYEKALSLFKPLVHEGQEPTLAAWAAWHVSVLSDVLNHPLDSGFRDRVERIAATSGSPAGIPLLEQLRKSNAEPEHPYLKLLHHVKHAYAYCLNGETTEAERLLANASQHLNSVPVQYATFAKNLLELAHNSKGDAVKNCIRQARDAFRTHDIPTVRTYLRRILEISDATAEQKEEAAVLLEACDVAEAAFAMLSRRCAHIYSPGCSDSGVRQAAATLGEKHLADELATLCLLLSGDYAAAVVTDPYRNDEESKAPFAVMMRDWKARLKL